MIRSPTPPSASVIDALFQERADRLGHQLSPEQQAHAQQSAGRITWWVTLLLDNAITGAWPPPVLPRPDPAIINPDATMLTVVAPATRWKLKQQGNAQ